jgi:peptide/nickel transport system permease protein
MPVSGETAKESAAVAIPPSPLAAVIPRSVGGVVSGLVLLLIIAVAVAAPWIAPKDPFAQDLVKRLSPPFGYARHDPAHLLGTDGFGRDYLSRLIFGSRVSLTIGAAVVVISGLIGTGIGMVAGYFGGRTDQVLMFVLNTRLALPIFLVAMCVVVLFGPSLIGTVLVLGLFLWDRFAMVTRTATRQAASQDYVRAARSIGCSHPWILLCEILPNILGTIIVIATIEMANAILLEASLSFLGFGIQEPTPSWGLMLAQARQYIFFDPWLLYIPGAALFILVLAINVFGDSLRDVLGASRPVR